MTGGHSDPQRVFLTGEPSCGKTTVLRKTKDLLTRTGITVGGMVTEETREAGSRTGFSVEDLMTGARGVLADLSHGEGPHVGKYSVNTRDLEQIGAEAVRQAINKVDVILIDELGPMELYSQFFIQSVESALGSPKHLIGTIHKRARHPLVVKVKSNPKFAVLEVTHDNRDELPKNITRRIIESK